MAPERTEKVEPAVFQVGTFICPNTKSRVAFMASCALAYIAWPALVEKCPDCGERHVLRSEDVEHAPTFGYE